MRRVNVDVMTVPAKPLSDSEMVAVLIGFAERALRETGEVSPLIVGLGDDGTQHAFTLPQISADKGEALAGASELLKQIGVPRYATLMESWFLDSEGKMPDVRPSQSERRREAVTVSVCDETGVLAFDMREIMRDSEGKFTGLGESSPFPLESEGDRATFGGTFTELLQ